MLSAWRSILTAPQSTLRMWWKGGPPSSKSSSAPRSPPPAPPAHISTSRQGVTIWSDYEMSRLGTVNSLGVTSQWSRRDSRIQTLSTAMDHHSTMSEGNMDIWQFIQQQQRSAVSSRVTPSLPSECIIIQGYRRKHPVSYLLRDIIISSFSAQAARTHKQTSITWDVGARSRSDAAASESKLYHIDESGGHDDVHEDIPSALLDDPKTTHMMSEAAAPASHPPTPASEPHNGLPTTTNIRSSPPTANTPAATAMADVSRGPSITSMPHNRYSISISFGNTVTDDPPPATPPALPPPGALSHGPDPPLGRPLPPSTLHSRPDDEPEIMEIVGIH
ncbi:hypothetical protein DL93DRAFT_358473 [Clavulina sp. PMI_390]|nr:hypothetical protein DL93DRAFT_358473 [Clavulina sp. PMI_390]